LRVTVPERPSVPDSGDFDLLRNSDIEWDGNIVGLCPRPASDRVLRIRAWGPEAVPALKRLLPDLDRYVVAHVLLSWISRSPLGVSGEQYNHLRVSLKHDGTV
jgi:hypothetical protein